MTFLTPYFVNRRLSSDLFSELDKWSEPFQHSIWSDVADHEDHVMLSVELPGFKQDEVKMDVLNNVLTISAESQREQKSARRFQSFKRSFRLPDSIQPEKIEARFEDGILDICLPKKEKEQPQRIEIQAGKGKFFDKLVGSKDSKPT